MKMKHLIPTVILAAFAGAAPALAGDPIVGETWAKRWCAECHDITGATTSDRIPGWREVANDPARPPERIRAFLVRPHGEMPPLTLSTREIDNLVAYIESLRKN